MVHCHHSRAGALRVHQRANGPWPELIGNALKNTENGPGLQRSAARRTLILRALQLLWVDARRAGTSAGPLGALSACGGDAG